MVSILETSFLVALLRPNCYHSAVEPNLYFWRASAGHEVDLLLDWGSEQVAVEIKSAETIAADFFAGLEHSRSLVRDPAAPAALVHGDTQMQDRRGVVVVPWGAL